MISEFFAAIPPAELYLAVGLGLLFIYQVVRWLLYGRLASYRNRHRLRSGEALPAVSVVMLVGSGDVEFIGEGLPLFLEQEHPDFEVVVVNDCGGEEVDDALTLLSRNFANLRFTTIHPDEQFNHSRKVALLVGIKAARHSNIVVADPDAAPASNAWLSYMSRGFAAGAEVVVGYTAVVSGNGFIRASRLSMAIRYLNAAAFARPYRAIYNNVGYTKELFFEKRGYPMPAMRVGEDDMFIEKIATKTNTSVIINPQSTLNQSFTGGINRWWSERRLRSYTFRYAPFGIKLDIFAELLTRFLLTHGAVAVGVLSGVGILTTPYLWSYAAALFVVREVVVCIRISAIATRLGERKIMLAMVLYDLAAPAIEAVLSLSRRIVKPKALWIRNNK